MAIVKFPAGTPEEFSLECGLTEDKDILQMIQEAANAYNAYIEAKKIKDREGKVAKELSPEQKTALIKYGHYKAVRAKVANIIMEALKLKELDENSKTAVTLTAFETAKTLEQALPKIVTEDSTTPAAASVKKVHFLLPDPKDDNAEKLRIALDTIKTLEPLASSISSNSKLLDALRTIDIADLYSVLFKTEQQTLQSYRSLKTDSTAPINHVDAIIGELFEEEELPEPLDLPKSFKDWKEAELPPHIKYGLEQLDVLVEKAKTQQDSEIKDAIEKYATGKKTEDEFIGTIFKKEPFPTIVSMVEKKLALEDNAAQIYKIGIRLAIFRLFNNLVDQAKNKYPDFIPLQHLSTQSMEQLQAVQDEMVDALKVLHKQKTPLTPEQKLEKLNQRRKDLLDQKQQFIDKNLTLEKVPGDGHCFYHAIIKLLNIDPEKVKEGLEFATGHEKISEVSLLRKITATSLWQDKDKYQKFFASHQEISTEEALHKHIERVANKSAGEWAGEHEMSALAAALQCPIIVFYNDTKQHQVYGAQERTLPPLALLFSNNNHFDAYIPKDQDKWSKISIQDELEPFKNEMLLVDGALREVTAQAKAAEAEAAAKAAEAEAAAKAAEAEAAAKKAADEATAEADKDKTGELHAQVDRRKADDVPVVPVIDNGKIVWQYAHGNMKLTPATKEHDEVNYDASTHAVTVKRTEASTSESTKNSIELALAAILANTPEGQPIYLSGPQDMVQRARLILKEFHIRAIPPTNMKPGALDTAKFTESVKQVKAIQEDGMVQAKHENYDKHQEVLAKQNMASAAGHGLHG